MDARELLKNSMRLRALLLDRLQLINANRAEMARLDKAGRIYATPHWRDGKYLYLLHPSDQPGMRGQREYVGAKPAAVKEALDKVQNATNYDALQAQTNRITHALDIATYQLGRLIDDLERVAPIDLATQGFGDTGGAPGSESVTNPVESGMVTDRSLDQLGLSPM